MQQILSPNPEDEGVWIHQDAWFHMGDFDKEVKSTYTIKKPGNGVYVFVLKGKFSVNEIELEDRDGLGLTQLNSFDIVSLADGASILLMEVPMQ